MKTTMYELLGMIKDGKAPKKIKYDRYTYWFCETAYHRENGGIICGNYLGDDFRLDLCLNDEVEIIDEPKEDKIEKLNLEQKRDGFLYLYGNKIVNQDFAFALKINELIDEVNKLKENNEPR